MIKKIIFAGTAIFLLAIIFYAFQMYAKSQPETTAADPNLGPSFETILAGVHHFTVKKTTTHWLKIPSNAYWDLAPVKDGNWKLITFKGEVVTYREGGKKYADFPDRTMIFKIQTDEKLDFILKVKPG